MVSDQKLNGGEAWKQDCLSQWFILVLLVSRFVNICSVKHAQPSHCNLKHKSSDHVLITTSPHTQTTGSSEHGWKLHPLV